MSVTSIWEIFVKKGEQVGVGSFPDFRQNLTGGFHREAAQGRYLFLISFNQRVTAAAQCDQIVIVQLQCVISVDRYDVVHLQGCSCDLTIR